MALIIYLINLFHCAERIVLAPDWQLTACIKYTLSWLTPSEELHWLIITAKCYKMQIVSHFVNTSVITPINIDTKTVPQMDQISSWE